MQKDVYVNINVAGVLIPKLCMYGTYLPICVSMCALHGSLGLLYMVE